MAVAPLRALNLDSQQQDAFVRFYKSLPEKPATTVRIFTRDDYYSVHGEDAELAAKELFQSSAAIKEMGSQHLPYVVLSNNNFENFVRKLLLVKQYRVEVYVNEDNKNNDWRIEFKGSPGNLSQFEQVLEEKNESNPCIIAIKYETSKDERIVGVTSLDVEAEEFYVTSFSDSVIFSQLEALLVQLSPKECLIQSGNNQDNDRLKMIMNRNAVLVTNVNASSFSTDTLDQDLSRLIRFQKNQKKSMASLPELSRPLIPETVAALIKYINLMDKETNFGKFKIISLDLSQYAYLDGGSIASLHLIPRPGMAALRENSLLGLLNRCRTPSGRKLLTQWIKTPVRDINVLNERLDIVAAFIRNPELLSTLYNEVLRGIHDLVQLAKRLEHKKANLQDCYKIYETIVRMPQLKTLLSNIECSSVQSSLVEPLKDMLSDMQKYHDMIDQVLDFDAINDGYFLIKASYDESLQELQEERDQIDREVKKELHKAIKNLDTDAVKLESNTQHGYHFRLSLKDEPKLRGNKHYKIIDSVKSGVRFTNDRLTDINGENDQVRKNYEEKQKYVVNEVVTTAATYSELIVSLSLIIGKLDVLVSFAQVATTAPGSYVRPTLLPEGSGIIKIQKARHPFVEIQESISYIPNDLDFDQNQFTSFIITGPNMGGKTTFLRSVGLIVLMAQIGCFVPCEEATISIVDAISVRAGSDDCEMKGLSTFMMEMVEAAGILKSTTKNSLVLIDELGRGTSTHDGFGIAWAIAEFLAKVRAFSLFATHYFDITGLADEYNNVGNRHVTAMAENDRFTVFFELKNGSCDKSYGIHLTQMIKFPDHVVKFAKELHRNLDPRIYMNERMNADVKRQIVKEGLATLQQHAEECSKWDEDNLSEAELKELAKTLRQQLLQDNNPFLKSLFTQVHNEKENEGTNNLTSTFLSNETNHKTNGDNSDKLMNSKKLMNGEENKENLSKNHEMNWEDWADDF